MVTLRDGKRVGIDANQSVESEKEKIKATSSSTKASNASAKPTAKAKSSTKEPPKPKGEVKKDSKVDATSTKPAETKPKDEVKAEVKVDATSTKASNTSAKPTAKAKSNTNKTKELPKPKGEVKKDPKVDATSTKPADSKPKDEVKAAVKVDATSTKSADTTPKPEHVEPASSGTSTIKDEVQEPKTPTKTPTESTTKRPYEKTPGRIGPIREEDSSIEFKISPFKGPKGKRVRKTAWEIDEEYGQRSLETPGHVFHALHLCYSKGPKGSPTYDRAGFELDYDKVANWMNPSAYNKSAMVKGMEKAVDRTINERERMKELFWEPGAYTHGPTGNGWDEYHWKDRVSKDLGVPWHKVGVAEFEKWDKMGFPKAKKGEYENFSKEERERISRMLSGASLRK